MPVLAPIPAAGQLGITQSRTRGPETPQNRRSVWCAPTGCGGFLESGQQCVKYIPFSPHREEDKPHNGGDEGAVIGSRSAQSTITTAVSHLRIVPTVSGSRALRPVIALPIACDNFRESH